MQTLKAQLLRYEGLSLKPYRCTEGKLTIGIGRNLEDKGLSLDEVDYLLNNDINNVIAQVAVHIRVFKLLNETKKIILLDMAFNLGVAGLCKFKNMLRALEDKNYPLAAAEMLDSRWAKQVGVRADELAQKMALGE
ncbi:hypothetical protein TW82_08980 [Pseudoalteromonas fuliginea]|uniref:Lysozyme n=1 Tax=Pseudoalteromonas fuliginea TaxID=1872678 RepID=A0ABD3YBK6_9GAMM|nr:hypothetical protein DO88_15475 [Pseudoalteromonas sp. S3431]KDC52225.1 hypothetical protein DC53_05865 [Pseudoalteromonas fuliginea]KJZ28088.1 hypothetical protein TW82_08980 [Pseudoalteromonas fuliginea]